MDKEITTIRLAMPLGMGSVNCYLIKTGDGFILIDTGSSNRRAELVSALEEAGCRPGLLKLIVITHGDFDHTGNAAHLRQAFGGRIAMHAADVEMAKSGDMFANRKRPGFLIRLLMPLFSGFGKTERFTPDFCLEDGENLSEYGWAAKVVSIPGHSKGSIGILTSGGDFFCGDLLTNLKEPALTALVDDLPAAGGSLQKLKDMELGAIYPGHGGPFRLDQVRG